MAFVRRKTRTFRPRRNFRKKPISKAVRAERQRQFNKRVEKVFTDKLETKKVTTMLGGVTSAVPLPIKASGLADSAYGAHIGNIFNNNNITVEQGTRQNQRIGRQINECSLWLKCCVQATFNNVSTNLDQYPFDVYCIIYKDKLSPNTNVPDQLKVNTDGHASKITGGALNFMLPFNKSRYTIYMNKRIGRFKPMPRDRTEGAAGSVLQNPTIGSNENIAYKYFTTKLPCPKTLEFKAAAGGQGSSLVTNTHLGVGFYVVNGSGVELGATQVRATVFPIATLYYKDA